MGKIVLIIDDVFDDTTIIDELYKLLVYKNIQVPVNPPNFIYKDDLSPGVEMNQVNNLLREIIQKTWMEKVSFLLKGNNKEVVGFECWNNNLPSERAFNSLAGSGGGLNYHLDKDEVASQNNQLILPLYATAFYIGPKEGINGGELMINTRGMSHYQDYPGGLIDIDDSTNWIKISYKYNRLVILDGTLPHFVMPVIALPKRAKRVSIGINPWDRVISGCSREN